MTDCLCVQLVDPKGVYRQAQKLLIYAKEAVYGRASSDAAVLVGAIKQRNEGEMHKHFKFATWFRIP
jgi:hypothetical protein